MNNTPQRYALALDAISSDLEILNNVGFLESLISEIAEKCNMTIINKTSSHIKVDVQKLGREPFEDEGGYSFLALISTSHIALHVWPERKAFMLDVVSCRQFSQAELQSMLLQKLKVKSINLSQAIGGTANF